MNSDLITVIIPTYNRAKTIGRSIRTVLNQTYKDFELIVIDDCSTDGTKEIVKSFINKKIKYVKHPYNKGAAAARNTGIKMAKGRYIAFQDSDDEWLPEKLEKQIKDFKTASSKVGVVYTGFWKVTNKDKIYRPLPCIKKMEGDIYKSILETNFISINAMIAAECFKKVGMFDENLPRLQDWELWIRISKYYHFKFINEPLSIAYHQKDSISTDQYALVKALNLIIKKHFSDHKECGKRLKAKQYYFLGNSLYRYGCINSGKKNIIKAAKIYPLNVKYIFEALFFFNLKILNSYISVKKIIIKFFLKYHKCE